MNPLPNRLTIGTPTMSCLGNPVPSAGMRLNRLQSVRSSPTVMIVPSSFSASHEYLSGIFISFCLLLALDLCAVCYISSYAKVTASGVSGPFEAVEATDI